MPEEPSKLSNPVPRFCSLEGSAPTYWSINDNSLPEFKRPRSPEACECQVLNFQALAGQLFPRATLSHPRPSLVALPNCSGLARSLHSSKQVAAGSW